MKKILTYLFLFIGLSLSAQVTFPDTTKLKARTMVNEGSVAFITEGNYIGTYRFTYDTLVPNASTVFKGQHNGYWEKITTSLSDVRTTVSDSIIQKADTSATTKTFTSISGMQGFSGESKEVIVSDSDRGGVFRYDQADLVVDSGTVFSATGKGSGFWVRQYEGALQPNWFGIPKDGSDPGDDVVKTFLRQTTDNEVFIPKGTFNMSDVDFVTNGSHNWKGTGNKSKVINIGNYSPQGDISYKDLWVDQSNGLVYHDISTSGALDSIDMVFDNIKMTNCNDFVKVNSTSTFKVGELSVTNCEILQLDSASQGIYVRVGIARVNIEHNLFKNWDSTYFSLVLVGDNGGAGLANDVNISHNKVFQMWNDYTAAPTNVHGFLAYSDYSQMNHNVVDSVNTFRFYPRGGPGQVLNNTVRITNTLSGATFGVIVTKGGNEHKSERQLYASGNNFICGDQPCLLIDRDGIIELENESYINSSSSNATIEANPRSSGVSDEVLGLIVKNSSITAHNTSAIDLHSDFEFFESQETDWKTKQGLQISTSSNDTMRYAKFTGGSITSHFVPFNSQAGSHTNDVTLDNVDIHAPSIIFLSALKSLTFKNSNTDAGLRDSIISGENLDAGPYFRAPKVDIINNNFDHDTARRFSIQVSTDSLTIDKNTVFAKTTQTVAVPLFSHLLASDMKYLRISNNTFNTPALGIGRTPISLSGVTYTDVEVYNNQGQSSGEDTWITGNAATITNLLFEKNRGGSFTTRDDGNFTVTNEIELERYFDPSNADIISRSNINDAIRQVDSAANNLKNNTYTQSEVDSITISQASEETTNNYVLTDSDVGKLFVNTSATNDTIFIPNGLNWDALGQYAAFEAHGAGDIVFVDQATTTDANGDAVGTVAVRTAHLRKKSTNNYYLGISQQSILSNASVQTISSDYTTTDLDYAILGSGATTITLHTPRSKQIISIKKTDATNTLTVATTSGNIDDSATFDLTAQYESITVIWDGTNWYIL